MGIETQRQPPVADATDERRRARGPRRWWPVLVVVVLALVVVRVFFLEPFKTEGVSMLPTLHSGDQVLVDKRAYRHELPRRGDLVVFRAPRSGELTIKRAIGLPGDSVAIEDGVLVVNGRRQVESYADPDAIDSVFFGPVRVRAGTFFALGDNRLDSHDSRDFGAVARENLVGRVRGLIWPPSRW